MLAALLGALSLFAAAQAQAQTTIWSATLTAKDLTLGQQLGGCDATLTGGECSSALTDDDFTYDGVEYHVTLVQINGGFLFFKLDRAISPGLKSAATLHVGSSQFPLENATLGASNTRLRWDDTGLSQWSVGDTVELKLVGTPPPPTVTLSASPNPVAEGSPVTVTATLSRALSNAVTILVRVTRNTSESGDHGTLTSITIPANAISGTGTITTNQDTDYEDETFTVSLDTANLPSSVTAGSPSSVPVTINDLGRTLLSSTLTVKQHGHLRGCNSPGPEDINKDSPDDIITSSCGPDPSDPSDALHALTEDTFAYNGVSYRIRRLTSEGSIPPHWQIVLGFDKRVPGGMIDVLCLWIDGSRLCLRDARDQNKRILKDPPNTDPYLVPALYVFGWQKTPIAWTVGQRVSLRFSDDGSDTIREDRPSGSPGSSGPPGALGPPPGSSGSDGGVGASGGPSGPPAGGGGGGGGGLPPSGSSDEPLPEDDELSTLCSQEDRENLERFYETTGGEQWDENENWNSEEPLNQWYGVDTDDEGEVVSLRLSENSLSGDTPEELLSCLSELKELALWGNDLSGEVPEELVLAVERAVLRDMAEMLDLNPEWFENYGDPYNFEDWHEGVTTDEEGRVIELVLPGEVPGTLISQLRKLRVITTSSENGGCALSPKDNSSAFSLFLLALLVFAALGRKRARG